MAVELLRASNDYVGYGDLEFLNGLTGFSLSIELQNIQGWSNGDRIVGRWGAINSVRTFLIQNLASQIGFVIVGDGGFGSGYWYGRSTTGISVSAGDTIKLCVTWSPGEIGIYVNGKLEPDTAWFSGTANKTPVISRETRLGYDGLTSGNVVDAYYSNLAIWNRKLSYQEAVKVTSGLSLPRHFSTGLKLYDPLTSPGSIDLVGKVLPDYSVTSTVNINPPIPLEPFDDLLIGSTAPVVEEEIITPIYSKL